MTFMNDEDDEIEIDYKSLLFNIKNSSFYQECKNYYKLKEMEIRYIMIEAEENNDYSSALTKLKEMEKIVFDYNLNVKIKNYIEDCQIEIANNEKKEIKKLLEKQEFDEAIKHFQKLLNNKNFFKFTYKEYLNTLEYIIKIKIIDETKEIPEIQIYKDFLSKNKEIINNLTRYSKQLNIFESIIF